MELRKRNNEIKKAFLNTWVKPGSRVLDVGCGQGGDIHKWRHIGVSSLVGVDPNPWAIEEARRRSQGNPHGTFIVGDIRDAPRDRCFDVICYNFSLQYQPLDMMNEIVRRLQPGTGSLFLGIVTDSTRLEFAESDGIQIQRVDEDHISVYIPDTPYYANGPVTEPLVHKDELVNACVRRGLKLVSWEPFSIYAKFVFQYQV